MDHIKFTKIMFQALTGMDEKQFERKAGLMRNPEGFEKPGYCPICKEELHQNGEGDLFCKRYSANYEKNGGCYWHRYNDGLNFWSPPEDMFKAIAEKDPTFKKIYEEHCKKEK